MEDITNVILALSLLILLAATSLRFGVENREGFTAQDSGLIQGRPN